ncbi:MAG: IclR family transcriptional regulator [Rhodospirillales bacterium]|nr:IclR family transcriptional regulator [Rhodospirillales bacterium]
MKETQEVYKQAPTRDRPAYSAPALEKGLDILELLSRSEHPLTQKDISLSLKRSISEIYRMITCLVERGYVASISDRYILSNKMFELAHLNSPTRHLLTESAPLMQKLSNDLDQSCHLTVYNNGRQIVLAKVDSPSGMGFSVRAGAELDVLVSASGLVLLAFQPEETQRLYIESSLRHRPNHANSEIETRLKAIRARGFESMPSVQVRGLYAVSFPILDTQSMAMAALTVPYAERIDQDDPMSVPTIEKMVGLAARELSRRLGSLSNHEFDQHSEIDDDEK